jgi:hypothetical protein
MTPQERIDFWREDAAVLRRRGARRTAALMERLASELEEDLAERGPTELVDLARAVELSGYTRGHLRRLLNDGAVVNHGTSDDPLVRASDLPRKASRPLPTPRLGAVSSRTLALVVAGRA